MQRQRSCLLNFVIFPNFLALNNSILWLRYNSDCFQNDSKAKQCFGFPIWGPNPDIFSKCREDFSIREFPRPPVSEKISTWKPDIFSVFPNIRSSHRYRNFPVFWEKSRNLSTFLDTWNPGIEFGICGKSRPKKFPAKSVGISRQSRIPHTPGFYVESQKPTPNWLYRLKTCPVKEGRKFWEKRFNFSTRGFSRSLITIMAPRKGFLTPGGLHTLVPTSSTGILRHFRSQTYWNLSFWGFVGSPITNKAETNAWYAPGGFDALVPTSSTRILGHFFAENAAKLLYKTSVPGCGMPQVYVRDFSLLYSLSVTLETPRMINFSTFWTENATKLL